MGRVAQREGEETLGNRRSIAQYKGHEAKIMRCAEGRPKKFMMGGHYMYHTVGYIDERAK